MKKLKPAYLLNLVAALAVMIAAPSCSDDTDLPAASADGDTVITLHVPNPSAAESSRSRAAGDDPAPSVDITTAEGAIKSLWLLAYDTKGSNHVVKQLQSSGEVSNAYSTYSIQFTPGSYRFYVVANLDSYINKPVSAATAEDELKAMILRFSPEKLPNLADGLPMACLHDEIDEADADGIVTIAPGEKKQVHADMTFLCAKVRYTILFNNDNGGFSYDTFGEHSISFTGASATGVIASTTLLRAESSSTEGSFDLDEVPLKSVNYVNEDNTGAWQGTVYLPENLSTEKKSLTTLLLNATLDDSEAALRYTITLPSPEKVTSTEKPGSLQRGHFYDLTGRVTSLGDRLDLTAEVKDWTLLQLVYDIHGPYFLHVEKTEVQVQSGVETLIKYDTDAGELQFESDKLDGKDLFVFSTVTGEDGEKYISINVNPEIPASNREVESHFYIKAANLRKRIEVKPARLNPFLNVTPTEIEINVREYISSGEYSAKIPISFTTNLDNVEISGFGAWDSSIALDGEMTTTEKTGTNNLLLTGMNGGDFWKSEHTLTLTYTATTGDTKIEETVTITVKPNVLNYLIHFRAPAGWTHPHIYVYQCLQLPANRNDSYKSKTVGYKTWNNKEDKYDYVAALEYCFTGKIAFKGWSSDSNSDNYYNQSGSFENGFFIFNKEQELWNCTKDDSGIHYNSEYDFCKTYRDSISNGTKYTSSWVTCANCGRSDINTMINDKDYTGGYNQLWPGIQMRNDGNGWWTFELSGAATPGKALIMFTDHHNTSTNRYPGHLEVGIPLFDYPNREGWFDLAKEHKQFTNTKPEDIPLRIYRLYFHKSRYAGVNIYYKDGSSIVNSNNSSDFQSDEEYYYYQWTRLVDGKENTIGIGIEGRTASGDYIEKNENYTLNSFVESPAGSGIYCYTRESPGNGEHSSSPNNAIPTQFLPGMTINLKWKSNFGPQIHVWETGGNVLTSWNDSGVPEKDGYRSKSVVVKGYASTINYIIHNGDYKHNNGTPINWNDVKNTYNSDSNSIDFTIEY